MFIKIIRDDDEPRKEGSNKGEGAAMKELTMEYFDTFSTKDELTYHRYLMSGLIPSIFLRTPSSRRDAPPTLRYHATLGMCISKKLTLTLTPDGVVVYGYIKNHKKTVKNGQARTQESEEYKAEARKVKPQSKSAKKSQNRSHITNAMFMDDKPNVDGLIGLTGLLQISQSL
ncbi:hypothetical protein Tco_0026986 [Tanacetum coccineum]